ncbi:MAG: CCA tRNA nucleotidyltransferase [bacterium]
MNYDNIMQKQLPDYIYDLLIYASRTAKDMGYKVFAVGGFVRDLILGKLNSDVDIVVEGDGIKFANAFAKGKDGRVKEHGNFGTAVIFLPTTFKIDIATARAEIYIKPGALPSIKFGSIRDDLFRRDFTINAIAIDLTDNNFGELVDFYGGFSDLNKGIIRIIHDMSFIDDPTRIFRALRFEQRFDFHIEPHTRQLMINAISNEALKTITMQRIRNELLLILKEDNVFDSLYRLEFFNILKHIHPALYISNEMSNLFDEIKINLEWWKSVNIGENVDTILTFLLALVDPLNELESIELSQKLVLNKKYSDTIKACKKNIPDIFRELEKSQILPSMINKLLRSLPIEVLIFAMSKANKLQVKHNIKYYLSILKRVKPLVNGKDLLEMGYPEGHLYKQILDKVFELQLNGLLKDKQQAIDYIKSSLT